MLQHNVCLHSEALLLQWFLLILYFYIVWVKQENIITLQLILLLLQAEVSLKSHALTMKTGNTRKSTMLDGQLDSGFSSLYCFAGKNVNNS